MLKIHYLNQIYFYFLIKSSLKFLPSSFFLQLFKPTKFCYYFWFKTNPIYSKSTDNITISNDIKSLPNIEGYGKVHSLHEAMQIDVSGKLKELVNNFINTTNPDDQKSLMNDILFKWTGVEGINSFATSKKQILYKKH